MSLDEIWCALYPGNIYMPCERKMPWIDRIKVVERISHNEYGSAIYTWKYIQVDSVETSGGHMVEIITLDLKNCTLTSVYNPFENAFAFRKLVNRNGVRAAIIVRDFNSRSSTRGYLGTDVNGEAFEEWAGSSNLALIHDTKLDPLFYSKRWKKGYNPHLIFRLSKISNLAQKTALSVIPRTQLRPLLLTAKVAIKHRIFS